MRWSTRLVCKWLNFVKKIAPQLHVHSNGLPEKLLEKQKSEPQKTILEVPTQLFGIWRKNMKLGQLDYLPEYIAFIYGN